MTINKGLMSSDSSEWETPQDLFNDLNRIYQFNLDPCATKDNAKCKRFYTKEDDGLTNSWGGYRVFMNPPYGKARPLFPLKQLQRAKFLITTLSKSKCFRQDPVSSGDSIYVFGKKIKNNNGFFFFNQELWKDFIKNNANILTGNDPLPSNPLTELAGLLTNNCSNPEKGVQKFYGGFVNHLDCQSKTIGISSLLGATRSRFTLMDMYTAFSINDPSRPSEVIVHEFMLPYIEGYIKWCKTAEAGIESWLAKAYREVKKGNTSVVVCLLPARTDTKYWHEFCTKGRIIFLKGRLKFSNSDNSAPFPSAIVIFDKFNSN